MEGIAEVGFGDWTKIDLRVAEIKNVEDIENADKLYKITLNLGSEIGERIICSGLKEFYSKEELEGRKIIYFSNLKPKKLRGVESQGMLLAACTHSQDGSEEKVVLISPEKDIKVGSRVS